MSEYPVEIDLGRKDEFGPANPVSPPTGKKGKARVFYPTLYIEGVEGMPSLPKEGCMMVKFRRKRMSVDENMDGKETTGVTLEIRKLCLSDDMAEEGDDEMQSAMKKFAKDSGVTTEGDEKAGEDDEDADEDEE